MRLNYFLDVEKAVKTPSKTLMRSPGNVPAEGGRVSACVSAAELWDHVHTEGERGDMGAEEGAGRVSAFISAADPAVHPHAERKRRPPEWEQGERQHLSQ